MKVNEFTRFPHPVLSWRSSDFNHGKFDVSFRVIEKDDGGVILLHEVDLVQGFIKDLLQDGKAEAGCLIKCKDTFSCIYKTLSYPTGQIDFKKGSLINRVTVRPLIVVKKQIEIANSAHIHEEFVLPISLPQGSIIGIGQESAFSVGNAKLAPIESVFELVKSRSSPKWDAQVDFDSEKIRIIVSPELYESVATLRGMAKGKSILLNALYLPVVMDVVDQIRSGAEQYEEKRWFSAISAKLDALNIQINEGVSSLEVAQKLLRSPLSQLNNITGDM